MTGPGPDLPSGSHLSRSTNLRVALFSLLAVSLLIGGRLWSNRVDTPALSLSSDGLLSPTPVTVADAGGELNPAPRTPIEQMAGDPSGSSTTTAPSTTLVTAPTISLPVPDLLPEDPYADTPEMVLGTISIPAIGMEEYLQSGMTLTAINRGPSHWPGTAQPGQLGNAVIAGHRTTFSRPFRQLDQLQSGDQVIYTTPSGTFTYAVAGTEIVDPDAVHIADQTVGYTSTLFACHPPGSAAQRIVVHLHLLDANGKPVPPPALALPPVTVPRA